MITVESEIKNLPDKPDEKCAPKMRKKRFSCQQCPKKYTRNLALTKHINSMHLKLKVKFNDLNFRGHLKCLLQGVSVQNYKY